MTNFTTWFYRWIAFIS